MAVRDLRDGEGANRRPQHAACTLQLEAVDGAERPIGEIQICRRRREDRIEGAKAIGPRCLRPRTQLAQLRWEPVCEAPAVRLQVDQMMSWAQYVVEPVLVVVRVVFLERLGSNVGDGGGVGADERW